MPIISTVQVTSFVQFDGDQSTAVHTRTVVEISEDGDVLIEDSAEIDNATNAVCVRQSAQVDTECSQMLLHSETQQDRPEFDPRAPPSDVTVEQCSDLVETEERKEARTHVTISPNVKRAQRDFAGGARSDGARDDRRDSGETKRKSITDESSLTQVSDLEKSFDEQSAQDNAADSERQPVAAKTSSCSTKSAKSRLPSPPVVKEIPIKVRVESKKSPGQTDGATHKTEQRPPDAEFDIDDAEGIDYEERAKQELATKDPTEHEVDMTRINLPKVLDILGGIRKKPEEIPKTPMQTIVNPLEEKDAEGAVEQVHHPKVEQKIESPAPLRESDDHEVTEDDRLSSESIRRRSLSQLGVRPKFSTLDLLMEDMSGVRLASRRTSLDIGPSSPSPSQRRASLDTQERLAEPRKVSFDVRPKDTSTSHRFEGKARPSKERRSAAPPPKDNSDSEDARTSSRNPVFPKFTEESTPRKMTLKPLRKQLRPSLGLRAKVRRPSRTPDEELTKASSRVVRVSKPKRSSAESASPPLPGKSVSKGALHRYAASKD